MRALAWATRTEPHSAAIAAGQRGDNADTFECACLRQADCSEPCDCAANCLAISVPLRPVPHSDVA
jgi:hypothetical protein